MTQPFYIMCSSCNQRILSWGGGREQDGSRMIAHAHVSMCLLGGSGGMPPPPRKILNLDPLRLQSGTILLFNTCDKTIITILNFKISGGGGNSSLPVWNPGILCTQHTQGERVCMVSQVQILGLALEEWSNQRNGRAAFIGSKNKYFIKVMLWGLPYTNSSNTSASLRIWTCDTRPLPGWGLSIDHSSCVQSISTIQVACMCSKPLLFESSRTFIFMRNLTWDNRVSLG